MAIPGHVSDEHYSTLHQGLTAYKLSDYDITNTDGNHTGKSWNWGLSHPVDESVFLYYDFYEYVDNDEYDNDKFDQLEGVIDWTNTNTTIPEKTTIDEWFKPSGIADKLIDKKLRTGLGLLK